MLELRKPTYARMPQTEVSDALVDLAPEYGNAKTPVVYLTGTALVQR